MSSIVIDHLCGMCPKGYTISITNMDAQPNKDPLHGQTLEMILNHLVNHYGWEEMNERVRINCFYENPSISSSLKFLRKTPWARKKVENLFLESLR